MIYESFELQSSLGEVLRCDIRYRADSRFKPVVLFLHGFKGFKDWGPFPAALQRIAESGFVAISFNFSHNGVGADLENFTELDRFAKNTFSRELDETLDVIREIRELDNIPISIDEVDSRHIGLLGHSRGGAMVILAGRCSSDVIAVASLSPVSSFDRYSERQKEKWRREGVFEVQNSRTKQVMPLNVTLLGDLQENRERLDIIAAASEYPKLAKPLLVISGEQDLTATPKEAQSIAEAAKGPLTELVLVPQTGHTFGAEHPFKGMTPALDSVIDRTIGFMQARLG